MGWQSIIIYNQNRIIMTVLNIFSFISETNTMTKIQGILKTMFFLSLLVLHNNITAQCGNAYIAGVIDGPLFGGTPKAIQICANGDIADLSIYALGSVNNGGGTEGEEYTFPAMSLSAGNCITVATESTEYNNYFGCNPDFVDAVANVNGDDAIELFCNAAVEDVFGDINTDGTGEIWEYLDGWAFSTDQLASGAVFDNNWMYSGPNALDGETNNSDAATPYPSSPCPAPVCNDIIVEAVAICSDDNNNFTERSYYVEVSSISGGTGAIDFNVTLSGATQNFLGTTLIFGPFSHSLNGTSVQTVSLADNALSTCTTIVEVAETFCTDLTGNGEADNDFVNCVCVDAAIDNTGGTIFSQAQPGTFLAGGSTDFFQWYFLTEANSGTTTILAANPVGLFTSLPVGSYYVYALNFKGDQAPIVSTLTNAGVEVNLTALVNGTAPYTGECYTVCGPALYEVDCSFDIASLACNDAINVTLGPNCDASLLSIDQLIENDVNSPEDFEITMTAPDGTPVDIRNETASSDDNANNFIGQQLVYSVTHLCSSATCWGNVTLEDKTPPELECDCPVGGLGNGTFAPECIFSCYDVTLLEGENLPSDIDDFVNGNIEDNCQNFEVESVTFEDDLSDLGACRGSTLRRTWTVSFTAQGGQQTDVITCTREYSFEPLTLSNIIAVDGPIDNPVNNQVYLPSTTVSVDCNAGPSPSSLANSLGVAFAFPHVYINGAPVGIEDNLCNINSTFSDAMSGGGGCSPDCIGGGKILRTWTILDWCTSDVQNHLQVIRLEDDQAPVLDLPLSISETTQGGFCTIDLLLPAPLRISDNCDSNVSYMVDGTSGGHMITGNAQSGFTAVALEAGTHQIFYSATDCCGNQSTATLEVMIKDNISPNAIAVESIAVPVYTAGATDAFAKVSAESIDNGSFDSCTEVTLGIRRDDDHCDSTDDEFGPFIHFCCEDMGPEGFAEIEVELMVTDECGNTNIVRSMVILQDRSSELTTCPDGMVIDCVQFDAGFLDDLSNTGRPNRTGICGDVNLGLDDLATITATVPASKPANASPLFDVDGDGSPDAIPPYDETCGFGALQREFESEGAVICTQYFVVESDVFNPGSIVWPQDMTVSCAGFELDPPTFDDVSCGHISVTVESDTINNNAGVCFSIQNVWTVLDWCTFDRTNGAQGRFTMTQLIDVVDDNSPIVRIPQNMNFDLQSSACSLDFVSIPLSSTDDDSCPNGELSWIIAVDYNNDGSIDVNQIESSFSGDTIQLALFNLPVSKSGHSIVATVTDNCGNEGSAQSMFTVTDTTIPTVYCNSVATSVGDDGTFELWAVDFDAGATDNCTMQENLRFTFTELAPPTSTGFYNPDDGTSATQTDFENGVADSWNAINSSAGRLFTRDDISPQGTVTVSVYVHDDCGNFDFCVVNAIISDDDIPVGTRTSISGQFSTELGESIQEVETTLKSNFATNPAVDMSDEDGAYAFADIVMQDDYLVKGYKGDDVMNGVNTVDIIHVQRHILGQERLSTPYKMIAADVNRDSKINGADLVALRKMILGVNDNFPHNESWTFVDADQELTLENPWIFRDSIMLMNLSQQVTDSDFIGVKLGDVDNTVVPNVVSQGIEFRNDDDILYVYDDQFVQAGDRVEVAISPSVSDVYGYQVQILAEDGEIVSLDGEGLTEANYRVQDDNVSISYNSDFSLSDGTNALTIIFVAGRDGLLSDQLRLRNTRLKSEAYVGHSLEARDIRLKAKESSDFKLYQNRPNPFTDQTDIDFELPESGDVTLTLYDLTGQILNSITKSGAKGFNTWTLSKSDINATGMVYYKLESGDSKAIRHMLIVE